MLKVKHALVLSGLVIALATTAPALAANGRGAASVLIEGEAVHPPRGYTEMCDRRPELCPARSVNPEMRLIMTPLVSQYGPDALRVHVPVLTRERFATLDAVNRTVNRAITPVEDSGGDDWSFSMIAGDCEEYVMGKLELLAQLGWPRTALRIAVVRGTDYQYHAVLVVSTDQGEFVLDNMVDHIERVEESAYEFVVAQSAQHPGIWVRVHRQA